MTPRQDVALVTGTSSGIGLATAVALAGAGLTVVATMRDTSRDALLREAAEQAGVELDVRTLDVTDADASRTVVDGVLADHGSLDVLVNNAGRGAVATLEQLSDAQLQEQLDVNYLAVARMTRLVLPAMRAAGRGRVVTVTSVGGAVGQPFADAYCGAKFAVEGLMQSLAPVVARFGVTVSIVEPGAVASEFTGNVHRADGADGADGAGATTDDPYAGLLAAYLRRTAAAFDAAQSPQAAAAVIVEAVTTTQPRFRWQTSPQAEGFVGLSLRDLDGAGVLGATSTWLT
ncbi:SDR family NAD(P)-dependent oxidoreductase [Phycicoccus sp. HDW14]|uniref:SDR family NAD(P)-dependent oxidoreductase n=1 Tax=Phycicoccus sp. HDW14 TaxID=2714941 RepID=UPI00140868D0|nr:SDR family NAD(P)-dependent oxidoreductase [Phycicoccus sp. HDW14]QIM22066.1 SDR family NAD(P)-dependent oxidoreductase [Phycicoccus sp. HDW14]